MCRRDVLTGLSALGLTSTVAAAATGAGVPRVDVASEVRRRAIALARGAFLPPVEQLPPVMAAMGYDEYRDLRFRPDRAVWHGLGLGFELQFFPAAYIYRSPVEIYLVEQAQHPAGCRRPRAFRLQLAGSPHTFERAAELFRLSHSCSAERSGPLR